MHSLLLFIHYSILDSEEELNPPVYLKKGTEKDFTLFHEYFSLLGENGCHSGDSHSLISSSKLGWSAVKTDWFFTANDVTDEDKRKAILFRSEEASTYSLIWKLLTPQKPGDITLEELVNLE